MLPSQQLKQQNEEAQKIALENAEKRKGESKASKAATKTEELPRARTPDLTGGDDVEMLRFPANVMMANGSSSLSLTNNYSNSMNISGRVERLVMMKAGFAYGAVATPTGIRWIIVMPTGMTAELVP